MDARPVDPSGARHEITALLVELREGRRDAMDRLVPLVYRELTALENLDLYGRLYRIPERRERIGMLLERFALWEARREPVSSFSRGMQQRLALCRALLHEPELLLLDEPFNALDEEGAELLDGELAGLRGRTFVVATHDPARLAPLATGSLALA